MFETLRQCIFRKTFRPICSQDLVLMLETDTGICFTDSNDVKTSRFLPLVSITQKLKLEKQNSIRFSLNFQDFFNFKVYKLYSTSPDDVAFVCKILLHHNGG